MSAEELYPGTTPLRREDPYATRSLVSDFVERQVDSLPIVGPSVIQRPPRRPPSPSWHTMLNVLLIVVIVAILASSAGIYYLDRSYQSKIYPNVTIQGIVLGERSPTEAEALLRNHYKEFFHQPAILTFGERTWQPSMQDLGITFDFQGAVRQAYHAGREGGLLENIQKIYAIWREGLEIPLHVRFDQRKMQKYLATIGAEIEQAPVDAQLKIDGLTVSAIPARVGRQVLIDKTIEAMMPGLLAFRPQQSVAIETRAIPARLDDAAVAEAKTKIEAMLQSPFTLKVGKKEYTWSPEEIALMLDIARVPVDKDTDRLIVALNSYQVERRIRQIADETGRGSVNPRVDWNNGNLKIIRPGKPGMRVDEKRAHELIASSIASPNRVLELPVAEIAPQVTEENLHKLGIKELVSLGQSDFTGSAEYRITNIQAGMRLLHGILIAPGEEFSFNENIGSIDAKNGFVEGYAIIQNRTQLEFGGGICQDSTTLFRAAFWAGLPITERWGHSFYISWYDKYGPTGMDATIFTGGPDLKFINDTGNWLLIQTSANPSTGLAQVALYGTKPNRVVKLTQRIYDRVPPLTTPVYVADWKQPRGTVKQTDTARGGMTIDIYRTIITNGTPGKPELFRTKFRPWPNIYAVNPLDMGGNGRPGGHSTPPADPAPTPVPQEAPAPEQPQPTPEPQPVPEQPQPQPTETSGG